MKSSTAIAVVAVLALFVVYWFYTRPAEEAPETLVVEEVAPAEPAAPEVTPPPPPAEEKAEAQPEETDNLWLEYNTGSFAVPSSLNESDEHVETAVMDLSPKLKQWLAGNERVRRLVMNVNVMASDRLPEKYPFFVFPMSPYKVVPTHSGDNTFTADPGNYERAKPLVDAVVSIPAKKLVAYYKKWEPTLNEAYGELGRKGSFSDRVNKALDLIIAAKPLPGKAVLKRDNVFYEYQDPKLEKSGRIQKWLWRLGPDNQKKIQAYAKQVKAVM